MENIKSLRVIFRKLTEEGLIVETSENQIVSLHCNALQIEELRMLQDVLRIGNVFNLLNVTKIDENRCKAEFLVFEPDCLLDISALAECFKPYGHHPLNYTLSRLQWRKTTASILLGNAANFFMDEFTYEDSDHPADFMASLKKLFHTITFELTTCVDLKNPRLAAIFFANCQKHFDHIRYAVYEFFPKVGIDRKRIILEPSFVSNSLGLQGRLDIMLCDYSKFIELKSGKALENFRTGQFIRSAKNHYIQMILYLAVLEFNLNVSVDDIGSYLLYSKYPILSKEQYSRECLRMALTLRNQIVACDYMLQKANDLQMTLALLNDVDSRHLNLENLSGKWFDDYVAPDIDHFQDDLLLLNKCDKAYFLRLYTFVTKELWLSKVGEREYEGIKKATVLWNASFDDKLIAGELLYGLTIADNCIGREGYTIRLLIPEYEDFYLPNFRTGDAVVLYKRNSVVDTVNNQLIFKGFIEVLDEKSITIHLRYRQKNSYLWNKNSFYAIEHDYMDVTFSGMFRGLKAFVQANGDRKELLTSTSLSSNKNNIFLLVGPPGTGKTSVAMKQMVETEWQNHNTNILLLSYTNRAVDEISKVLLSIDEPIHFIRIGNELTCAPEYRSHLLENHLNSCVKRKEVTDIIARCRIFVGTVTSVWNKSELFQFKQFDLAIVDEATQLLEPHLVGIICAKNSSGTNAIRRFVLIGDHKQLPAIVLQTKEESRVTETELNAIGLINLSESLFERLYRKYRMEGCTDCFSILSKQGRMHPVIAAFPSKYFYDGKLECIGLPHQIEQQTHRKRLNFYSVKPSEKELSCKINRQEAKQVVSICLEIYQDTLADNEVFCPQNIGIITPFRNQIALIRQQLQETGITALANIIVDSVERFQGSQCDIVIYSFCIKTNSQMASLPNWLKENDRLIDRKLNVVLTRARKELHIIGNEELLNKNPLYRQLIEHIKNFSSHESIK